MKIPPYPEFVPLGLELKDDLHPRLSLTPDGVSEFTFAGLYLFRERYGYRISRFGPEEDPGFIVSGIQPEGGGIPGKFFSTPCGAPDRKTLEALFADHLYWKNLSDTVLSAASGPLADLGLTAVEDRDNFDYLYARDDLAELAGKKYHKKRNLIQQFLSTYSWEEFPLTEEQVPAALEIVDTWRQGKEASGDTQAAIDALNLFRKLELRGSVFFVDGEPASYCLGESVAAGRSFAIHFEKGIDRFKGIYQFVNRAFARSLPASFVHLNREQDLGDEGLRQAKMSYRPAGFVKKYVARGSGAG